MVGSRTFVVAIAEVGQEQAEHQQDAWRYAIHAHAQSQSGTSTMRRFLKAVSLPRDSVDDAIASMRATYRVRGGAGGGWPLPWPTAHCRTPGSPKPPAASIRDKRVVCQPYWKRNDPMCHAQGLHVYHVRRCHVSTRLRGVDVDEGHVKHGHHVLPRVAVRRVAQHRHEILAPDDVTQGPPYPFSISLSTFVFRPHTPTRFQKYEFQFSTACAYMHVTLTSLCCTTWHPASTHAMPSQYTHCGEALATHCQVSFLSMPRHSIVTLPSKEGQPTVLLPCSPHAHDATTSSTRGACHAQASHHMSLRSRPLAQLVHTL